jgi:hypothetical protein
MNQQRLVSRFVGARTNGLSHAKAMRDHAHTLSDFRVPPYPSSARPAAGAGRYSVAPLIEKYGDMKLRELRHVLANCSKANAHSVYDRCRIAILGPS